MGSQWRRGSGEVAGEVEVGVGVAVDEEVGGGECGRRDWDCIGGTGKVSG